MIISWSARKLEHSFSRIMIRVYLHIRCIFINITGFEDSLRRTHRQMCLSFSLSFRQLEVTSAKHGCGTIKHPRRFYMALEKISIPLARVRAYARNWNRCATSVFKIPILISRLAMRIWSTRSADGPTVGLANPFIHSRACARLNRCRWSRLPEIRKRSDQLLSYVIIKPAYPISEFITVARLSYIQIGFIYCNEAKRRSIISARYQVAVLILPGSVHFRTWFDIADLDRYLRWIHERIQLDFLLSTLNTKKKSIFLSSLVRRSKLSNCPERLYQENA